ncbi:hypothetical protein [Marinisporobacter balticus]|uniref:Uncharacterized protein n=1 Tax=Marinisporobacter balticus TaxID=2018667 RepID=A0A4R2KF48_9FIRM|nr:hypothetical protein [Marinisporobacter balticus]TCO72183.1 hypothetical protein EV214_11947 [Marinisporobacter balticus]
MEKFYYCKDCRRIEKDDTKCGFCSSEKMKLLKVGDPVNIMGTKQKGKIFNIKEDEANLLIINGAKEKLIKRYKYEEIQKIL